MKSVELFAGAGGLGLGVGRAGFSHQKVVEIDKWACDTLKQNTTWPLYSGDVRRFDYGTIEGGIDLVTGGPPDAVPWSGVAGADRHRDARRGPA